MRFSMRSGALGALLVVVSVVAALAAGVAQWAAGTTYRVGDLVAYSGITYRNIQAHRSIETWTPPETPALWQALTTNANASCAAVPPAPTGLATSNLSASGVTLEWTAPTMPDNCSSTGYTVYVNGTSVGTTLDTSYAISGLSASTSYRLTVTASDSKGTSAASTALTVTTLAAGSGDSCAATWSASTVYTGGKKASLDGVNYKANWWTQGNNPATNNGASGTGQPWTITGACAACSVAPAAPTGLAAFGVQATSLSLSWSNATVPSNCTVTSYIVYRDGTQVGTTTGTSFTATGLTAETAYSFAVAAVDPAGTSAKSTAVSVTTASADDVVTASGGFAPYIDMSLTDSQNLLAIQQASGIKTFTLAFILSSGGCNAAWGGIGSIANDTTANGTSILELVAGVRAAGGDVIISFGGANGQEPALVCTSATALQAVYQSVVDRYAATSLDFDIEGGSVADTASLTRRAQAIVGLKAANPGLKISFTLPVLPTGLVDSGVAVLSNAKANGLVPDVVNIMAMDYGTAVDNNGQMGLSARQAAAATKAQVDSLGLSSTIGVTPMIGRNDVASEVFTLSDAATLVTFAKANSYITRLSMWSVSRDNDSCGSISYASPTCSSIVQDDYAFSEIFSDF